MPGPILFLDDPVVATAIDEACDAAVSRLSELLPNIDAPFRQRLRSHMVAMLTGQGIAGTREPGLTPRILGDDAFGDRFSLEDLPLPRSAAGYAVQRLDTDELLDKASGRFLAVRNPALDALFDSFDTAYAEARKWVKENPDISTDHGLAIVPATYDDKLHRHVLIYGVLTRS